LDQIGDLIGEAEEFYLGGFLVYVSSYVSRFSCRRYSA
jgi:hypothetical protein